MTRKVILVMPDGSVQPVDDVPDNIKDEQVQKRYGAERVLGTGEDVLRSAKAGLPFGLIQLGLAPLKAGLGLSGLLAERVGNKDFLESIKRDIKGVRGAEERALEATGAGYVPATKAGDYAKSAAGGASTAVLGGPAGLATRTALGAASGVAAQGASDVGLGEAGAFLASMVPYGVSAGIHTQRPGAGYEAVRDAERGMTPAQRAQTNKNLAIGQKIGLDPMIYQAAPESSLLRHLGERSSLLTGTDKIQARVQEQLPVANQELVKKVTKPFMDPVAKTPVGPPLLQDIRDAIRKVVSERQLSEEGSAPKVEAAATKFGKDVQQPWTQNEIVTRIQDIGQQLKALPTTDPQVPILKAERTALLQGNVPKHPPSFVPGSSKTLGNIEDIRQTFQTEEGPFHGAAAGVKDAVRGAIAETAGKAHPPYKAALRQYGDVKDVVGAVEETAKKAAGRNIDQAIHESRTSAIATVPYAIATNPWWASIPKIRDIAARRVTKNLDDLLSKTSLEEMTKAAQYDPSKAAMLDLLRALAQPSVQGYDPTQALGQ